MPLSNSFPCLLGEYILSTTGPGIVLSVRCLDIIRIIRPFAQNNRKCRQIINPFLKVGSLSFLQCQSAIHSFVLANQNGYDTSAYRFAQLETVFMSGMRRYWHLGKKGTQSSLLGKKTG
jgi:hypothetical protein